MFEQFKEGCSLEEEKWNEYLGYFHRLEIPAKTILLNEGSIAQKMFIIEKGCLRVWVNSNGKEITTQFFFENEMVGSIESLLKTMPSAAYIESIEPSVLWWIHKNDLNRIIDEIKDIPKLRDKYINRIFERTFDYMKYFFSSLKDTPQQRYLNIIRERPQIVQRVPQHYIASYLGISSVHLSRIKNKLAKEKP